MWTELSSLKSRGLSVFLCLASPMCNPFARSAGIFLFSKRIESLGNTTLITDDWLQTALEHKVPLPFQGPKPTTGSTISDDWQHNLDDDFKFQCQLPDPKKTTGSTIHVIQYPKLVEIIALIRQILQVHQIDNLLNFLQVQSMFFHIFLKSKRRCYKNHRH